jgi:hypothetical protein
MEARGAISAADVARFARDAEPGSEQVYAWGDPDAPRALPGFREARRAYERGLVVLRWRASDGRREYLMRKVANRARAKTGGGYVKSSDIAHVMDRLRRAAEFQLPCPTNEEIDAGLVRDGFGERDASYLVALLRKQKKIITSVEGPGRRRVVTIVSTGKRTAQERG